MNFWLRDAIPAGELEKEQDPYELFFRMVNAELVSLDNLYFLATLLSLVREDLLRELLKDQQFEGKLIVLKTAFCLESTAICAPDS